MSSIFSRPFTYLPARPGRREPSGAGNRPLEEHFVNITLDEGYQRVAASLDSRHKSEPFDEWARHCTFFYYIYIQQVHSLLIHRLCSACGFGHIPVNASIFNVFRLMLISVLPPAPISCALNTLATPSLLQATVRWTFSTWTASSGSHGTKSSFSPRPYLFLPLVGMFLA